MTTRYLIVIALVWVGIGAVVAFVMRRRGHDFWVWLAIGSVLGPLIIPLAIERARFHGFAERQSLSVPTPTHRGFDIVAGVDGSEESLSAIKSALRLFGDQATSLTIATVLDYDSESSAAGVEPREEARALLADFAARTGRSDTRTEILFGRADKALAEFARSSGAELIVVGARGHGATEALFGSITGRLVGMCEIPVFVGPTPVGREEVVEANATSGVDT